MNFNKGSPLVLVKMAAGRVVHGCTIYRHCLTSLSGIDSILPNGFPLHTLSSHQICSRTFADTRAPNLAPVLSPDGEGATVSPSVAQEDPIRHDRYIPITRRHLVRSLMEETKLLTGSERDNFTRFAAALDAHLYQKYYEYLDKMKVGVHLYGGYTTLTMKMDHR